MHQELYAQPIASVKEVIEYHPPAPVPGAPSSVEGVLNVRGEVITVVDGHRLLDTPAPADKADQRIVIVDGDDERFGVVVDSVEEIVSLPAEVIEPVEHSQDHTLMVGTARHADGLLILVDLLKGAAAVN